MLAFQRALGPSHNYQRRTTLQHFTIATRESRLALWQAHHVQSLLQSQGHQVSLLGMTTKGDQILDRSLSKVGGKGLFVKELETALEEGRADLAVHSLKDVPMELPAGFSLACVMEREDPRDAWVSTRYPNFSDLPQGAVVGTSSLRRVALLRALRPDLRIEPLRGNLDTRLKKLDEGQYDGIVLAAAGLVLYEMGGLPVHDSASAGGAPPSIFKYLKSAENRPEVPSVSFTDKDGKDVALKDFQGRFVVLNLWATWCGPCVTELPALAKLKAALPEGKFAVVTVDLEKNDAAKVSDFLSQHKADALTVYVDRQLALMRSFTAYALPLTVIIDPTGHERARAVGPEQWDAPEAIAYLKGLASGPGR